MILVFPDEWVGEIASVNRVPVSGDGIDGKHAAHGRLALGEYNVRLSLLT
jgi:hypothetical protein